MTNFQRTVLVLLAGAFTVISLAIGPSPARAGQHCTVVGTPKADVLQGTKKSDVICGAGGADKILAGAGSDLLRGGPGDDVLNGGPGADSLIGGNGDDILVGGGGRDRFTGGAGQNTCVARSQSVACTAAGAAPAAVAAQPPAGLPAPVGVVGPDTPTTFPPFEFGPNECLRPSEPSGCSDTTAPGLYGLTFSPEVIEGSAGGVVAITANVFDQASPVASVVLTISGPSGTWQAPALTQSWWSSQWFLGSVQVPPGSPPGTYSVTGARLEDAAGNVFMVSKAAIDLQALWAPSFQVTAGPDTESPWLASLEFSPSAADTAEAGADVQIRARVIDAAAGVKSASALIRYPYDSVNDPNIPLVLTSGSRHDGIWTATVPLRQWAVQGFYGVSLALTDRSGNAIDVSEEMLSRAGYPSGFSQTAPGDLEPPEITGFSLTEVPDQWSWEDRLAWSLEATDDRGIGLVTPFCLARFGLEVRATFERPNGRPLYLHADPRPCADQRPRQGTWTGTFDFDWGTEGFPRGTYELVELRVADGVGRETVVDRAGLADRGWNFQFVW